jgi:hypothetical protein
MSFSGQKLSDASSLSPELNAVIAEDYRVFSRYEIDLPLRVCRCPVCVTDEAARALVLACRMDELIEMVALAGGDLPRLLATLETGPDPFAALHIASLAREMCYLDGAPFFQSAMLEKFEPICRDIGAFLADPRHAERLERAFFALEGEPDLQQVVSDGQMIIAGGAQVWAP